MITILYTSQCPVIEVCAMHVIVIVCLVALLGHSVQADALKLAIFYSIKQETAPRHLLNVSFSKCTEMYNSQQTQTFHIHSYRIQLYLVSPFFKSSSVLDTLPSSVGLIYDLKLLLTSFLPSSYTTSPCCHWMLFSDFPSTLTFFCWSYNFIYYIDIVSFLS